MQSWEEFKREEFAKKPGLKEAYDKLQPEYELVSALIETRIDQGLSQSAMAKKMGTTQSAIARIESGNYNPTLKMLRRIAEVTGRRLKVTFEK